MPEGGRAQDAGDRNVVRKVDRSREPGAQEQYDAPRQYAGVQRLRFLHVAVHQGCSTPVSKQGSVNFNFIDLRIITGWLQADRKTILLSAIILLDGKRDAVGPANPSSPDFDAEVMLI
jgi:hypothetical protein